MRQRAFAPEIMAAQKLGEIFLRAEPQIGELHRADDRIIVIGLHEIHRLGPNAGHPPRVSLRRAPSPHAA